MLAVEEMLFTKNTHPAPLLLEGFNLLMLVLLLVQLFYDPSQYKNEEIQPNLFTAILCQQ